MKDQGQCYDCLKNSNDLTIVTIENNVKVKVCKKCLKEYYELVGKKYILKDNNL